MKTIADRLYAARTAKKLTQAQLAVLANISQGAVGNIESGGRAGIGSLAYMAEPLGVSFRWLADGVEPKYPTTSALTPGAAMQVLTIFIAQIPPELTQTARNTLAQWALDAIKLDETLAKLNALAIPMKNKQYGT